MDIDDITYFYGSQALRDARLIPRSELNAARRAHRRAVRKHASLRRVIDNDLSALRAEVEYLSLVLTSLIAQLDAKGVVTREDLHSLMLATDEFDGRIDARLPVAVLDELLRGDAGELEVTGGTSEDPPSGPSPQ